MRAREIISEKKLDEFTPPLGATMAKGAQVTQGVAKGTPAAGNPAQPAAPGAVAQKVAPSVPNAGTTVQQTAVAKGAGGAQPMGAQQPQQAPPNQPQPPTTTDQLVQGKSQPGTGTVQPTGSQPVGDTPNAPADGKDPQADPQANQPAGSPQAAQQQQQDQQQATKEVDQIKKALQGLQQRLGPTA
jgi:hypothetical protein